MFTILIALVVHTSRDVVWNWLSLGDKTLWEGLELLQVPLLVVPI